MKHIEAFEAFLSGDDFSDRKSNRNKVERKERKSRKKRQRSSEVSDTRDLETSPTRELVTTPKTLGRTSIRSAEHISSRDIDYDKPNINLRRGSYYLFDYDDIGIYVMCKYVSTFDTFTLSSGSRIRDARKSDNETGYVFKDLTNSDFYVLPKVLVDDYISVREF